MGSKLRTKTADLGLDPDDTTPQELYQALRAKLAADNAELNKELGFERLESSDAYLERFSEFVQNANVHSEIWGIKWSVARKLLREHPPKKLMKSLNYRSVDSMLKREFIGELFAALPLVESERWLNVFWRDVANLAPADFENRRIQVVIMGEQRWSGVHTAKQAVETLPHVGVIALWSTRQVRKLGVLGLGLEFFDAVNRLKAESSYLKLKQFDAGFGEQLLQVIKHELEPLLKFTTMSLDWHMLSRQLGHSSTPEWLPPHMQHEDIHTRPALRTLADLAPSLRWWCGLEHLASHSAENLVSLNPSDLLDDEQNNRTFQRRSTAHLAESFWHQLIKRYLDFEGVRSKVMGQIDGGQMQTETVAAGDVALEDFEPKNYEVGV
jgi:hypothetical protein